MQYKKYGGTGASLPEKICNSRGTTLTTMLHTDKRALQSQKDLDNITEAANELLHHLRAGNKIYIQQDSDIDGLSSTAILYNYIARIDESYLDNIYIEIHEGKQHGLFPDKIIGKGYSLAIAPDASSNEYHEHKRLHEAGISVIVLDHHDCEKYSEHAIVVNNQLSKRYHNKSLCGGGVVYQFCRELDEILGVSYADDYLDFVAVSLIGDMMDVTQPETRYLIDAGLRPENRKSKVLKQIFENIYADFIVSKNVAYSVAPLFNATIRVGEEDLKRRMLNSTLCTHESSEVISNKRGVLGAQKEPLTTQVLRNMNNAKALQKRQVDALVKELVDSIDESIPGPIVLCIGDVNPTLIGLVANIIANKYQRPAIVLREREKADGTKAHAGSIRAYGIDNLKDVLSEMDTVVYAEGHQSAAGIEITCLESFKTELIGKFSDYKFEPAIMYDEEYSIGQMPPISELHTVARLNEKAGQGFPAPILKITGLNLNAQNTGLRGSRGNMVGITCGGYSFTKYFANKTYLEDILRHSGTTTLYVSVMSDQVEHGMPPFFEIQSYEPETFTNYIF